MRAFVALPCPEPWIGPLMRAQAHLPGGRKVDADDLHLTLAFLDDQPEARLEALAEELDARALPSAPLAPLSFAPLGSGKPRAIVLDIEPNVTLTDLRDRVRGAARRAGIALSRDRFRPHVTLVRYGPAAPADTGRLPGLLARLTTDGIAPQTATGVTLWSSVLTPAGPLYDVLASYPLRAA